MRPAGDVWDSRDILTRQPPAMGLSCRHGVTPRDGGCPEPPQCEAASQAAPKGSPRTRAWGSSGAAPARFWARHGMKMCPDTGHRAMTPRLLPVPQSVPDSLTLPQVNPAVGCPTAKPGCGAAQRCAGGPEAPTCGAERWREEREAGLALLRFGASLLNAVGQVAWPHGQGRAGWCPASVGLAVGRQHPASVGLRSPGWDLPHGTMGLGKPCCPQSITISPDTQTPHRNPIETPQKPFTLCPRATLTHRHPTATPHPAPQHRPDPLTPLILSPRATPTHGDPMGTRHQPAPDPIHRAARCHPITTGVSSPHACLPSAKLPARPN